MVKKRNRKNKKLLISLLIIISLTGVLIFISEFNITGKVISASAVPDFNGHSADNILVKVKGCTVSLQQAINNNFYMQLAQNSPKCTSYSQDYLSKLLKVHYANEIEVIVNDNRMTLQQAIDSLTSNPRIFCIGGTQVSQINNGHNANEINIQIYGDGTKTLQDAINAGNLCGCPTITPLGQCNSYCPCAKEGFECAGSTCSKRYYDWTGACDDFCKSKGLQARFIGRKDGVFNNGDNKDTPCVNEYNPYYSYYYSSRLSKDVQKKCYAERIASQTYWYTSVVTTMCECV